MKRFPIVKAFVLGLILFVISIGGWEFYLRSKNIKVDYDDGKELWSDKRAQVYKDKSKATVFIGASRNKYAIDIATWKRLTGEEAIQLAIEGANPLPVLDNLANDIEYRGKTVIDVTESLLFNLADFSLEEPQKHVAYFKERTPAQRASFALNHLVESQFVFIDKYNFTLNRMLSKLPLKNRPGVFALPNDFPMDFGRINFERQNVMTKRFETDTFLQNQVKNLWSFFDQFDPPPITGKTLDSVLLTIKTATDKIISRGGQVVFVRTPCNGHNLELEDRLFPRQSYWERILQISGAPGIHFKDYNAMSHFVCPEDSHLKLSDAVHFTTALIDILSNEKGWHFAGYTNK